MHCHTAGIGAGDSGCFVSQELMESYKLGIYLRSFYVTQEELEQHGDQLVVRRLSEKLAQSKTVSHAIVLALDGMMDSSGNLDSGKTEVYIPNDFVFRETAKYPNLLFGASINPHRKDALKQLETWADSGAQLVKWIPSIQDINPSDTALIPFYSKLVERGIPLLTHVGQERSFSRANDALGDPELLKLPLELGVTVIAAHVATTGETDGQPNHERLIPMFKRYPNLYADISTLTQINKKKYLKKILAHEEIIPKLIYGTDMPLINTLLVSPWYYPIRLKWKVIWRLSKIENPWDQDVALKRALGLPEEVFRNGEKLFRIPGE